MLIPQEVNANIFFKEVLEMGRTSEGRHSERKAKKSNTVSGKKVMTVFWILLITVISSMLVTSVALAFTVPQDNVENNVEKLETPDYVEYVYRSKYIIEVEEDSDSETEGSSHKEAIPYSDADLLLYQKLVYAEAGGETRKCQIATAWCIRNSIVAHDAVGDFSKEVFRLNAYEPSDPYSYTIYCGQGIVQEEYLSEEFKNMCKQVLDGEIPSPVEDWYCFLGFTVWGYDSGYEFASVHHMSEYRVIGRGIFFPVSSWTEYLNDIQIKIE